MTNSSSARCKSLLDWYARQARALPWRETDNPYAIWVSEIMLQQTQVKTVLPRYQQWFTLFPDIAALAAASVDDVLRAWQGLGYYRRARLMHQAAQKIMASHHGCFPQRFNDILALPGIGPSTAGAIASFCFGERTPVLDGNVKRVLKRWYAMPNARERELWQQAQTAIDASPDPAMWNQAMMELGATLCRRAPDCASCPVRQSCASAFRQPENAAEQTTVTVQHVHWQVHLHIHKGHGIWITRRPEYGIWGGLWAPPITELSQKPVQTPCHVHQLTHRRLHLYTIRHTEMPAGEGRWCHRLTDYAMPTGILRLLHKHHLIDDAYVLYSLDEQ